IGLASIYIAEIFPTFKKTQKKLMAMSLKEAASYDDNLIFARLASCGHNMYDNSMLLLHVCLQIILW
ncbi:hypothetical protein ACJX0J_025892, partial [Zea mays]